MEYSNTQRGFTLVELLVVVLIIGILTAVALPQYRIAVAKSRYSTLKHLVVSAVASAETYYLANGVYPTVFSELDIEPPEGNEFSDSNHSLYNWGWCRLLNNSSGARISCHNSSIGMEYEVYFQHSISAANVKCCMIRGTKGDMSDWRIKICQSETGKIGSISGSEQVYSACFL